MANFWDPNDSDYNDQMDDFEQSRIRTLRLDRINAQKKAFTKWCNSFLSKIGMEIDDLFRDLQDGKRLIKLLEMISGEKLGKPNQGKLKVHKIENVNIALGFLSKTRLENIGAEDIVDGNPTLILGLIWTLILEFQIQDIQIEVENESKDKRSANEALLLWCQRKTTGSRQTKRMLSPLEGYKPERAQTWVCQNDISQKEICINCIGKDGIGKDDIGKNGIGKNSIGKNRIGKNSIGKNGIGKNGIGKNGICEGETGESCMETSDISRNSIDTSGLSKSGSNRSVTVFLGNKELRTGDSVIDTSGNGVVARDTSADKVDYQKVGCELVFSEGSTDKTVGTEAVVIEKPKFGIGRPTSAKRKQVSASLRNNTMNKENMELRRSTRTRNK